MPSSLLSEQLVSLLKPFSFTILLLLCSTPILIKWFFYKNPETRKPSPPKLPLIGNLHQLGGYPHRSLQKLSQRYGPIMFLFLGSSPAVIISSPEGAREIMQTHDLTFANRPESKIFKKLLYNMQDVSTAPYGEYWRQMKSICTLQLFFGFSEPVNLSEMFALISKNVVCRAAIGRKYDDGESGRKFRKLWLDIFGLLGLANIEDSLPWLGWVNRINGRNAAIDRVAKELDDFLEGLVGERLARLERVTINEENYEKPGGEAGENFLDILIRIYKDQEAPASLGRDNVKAIILEYGGFWIEGRLQNRVEKHNRTGELRRVRSTAI